MRKFSYLTAVIAAFSAPALAEQIIPTDMAPTCDVTKTTFNGWFDTGAVSPNGKVKAPNSSTFTTDNGGDPNVCDFYKWGSQMFLWLTSTDSGKHVLDGPSFFTVEPANASGKRAFISNAAATPKTLKLRSEKTDGDNVGEIGQAGSSGVLMSQAKSLVYYGLATNDAYAYFLTGQKTAGSMLASVTEFPHSPKDLKLLEKYVKAKWPKVTLQTGEQLAMELKTSWVDASTLPNPDDYITIEGTVPNFVANADNSIMDVSSSTPTITLQLALTGMHVVGTVQDHPEFIWATFEHINNAPDAPYYYLADDGTISLHAYDSNADFLFMKNGGAMKGANVECMAAVDGTIQAQTNASGTVCEGGIVPSNTVREYPWGSLSNDASSGTVTNNTLLLSINHAVRSKLDTADARKNYIQTGSVWTTTPSGGGDAPIPNQVANQAHNLRGSTSIANMTMETYTQGTNCFSCHSLSKGAPDSFAAFGLSHIYSELQPITAAN